MHKVRLTLASIWSLKVLMMSDVLDTWKDYFARINERRAA